MHSLTKKQLEAIVKDAKYQSILDLFAIKSSEWDSQIVKLDTEFETIWNLAFNKGKIEGVREFLNEMEKSTQ